MFNWTAAQLPVIGFFWPDETAYLSCLHADRPSVGGSLPPPSFRFPNSL